MRLRISEEELITFVSANILCAIDNKLLNFDFDTLHLSAEYDIKDTRYWLKIEEEHKDEVKTLGSLGVPLKSIETEKDRLRVLIETAGVIIEILKKMHPQPVLHVIKGGLDGSK